MKFLKHSYEMTAVAKAGFLADVGKVEISETKKIFCFLDSHHFDKMPAGLPVVFFKFCGKVRITHVENSVLEFRYKWVLDSVEKYILPLRKMFRSESDAMHYL